MIIFCYFWGVDEDDKILASRGLDEVGESTLCVNGIYEGVGALKRTILINWNTLG